MSEMFTVEQWYPALIKFFDKLENYMSTKIYIAPHPKTKHEKAITAITEYPNVIILILSPNNSVFYLSSVYWMMSTKENLIPK